MFIKAHAVGHYVTGGRLSTMISFLLSMSRSRQIIQPVYSIHRRYRGGTVTATVC
jgi:hypothetical protein